jgi:hypothetical protein
MTALTTNASESILICMTSSSVLTVLLHEMG